MRLSTALRIAGLIIIAKAVLIGVVYWRRAEILGRPIHIGADGWMIAITIGLALAAGVYVTARHYGRGKAYGCPATRHQLPSATSATVRSSSVCRPAAPVGSGPHGYIRDPDCHLIEIGGPAPSNDRPCPRRRTTDRHVTKGRCCQPVARLRSYDILIGG